MSKMTENAAQYIKNKAELDAAKKQHEEIVARLSPIQEALAQSIIDECMDSGLESMRITVDVDGEKRVYTVTPTLKTFVSALPDHEEMLFEALRAAGFGDVIKPKVHPKTLEALVREQIAERGLLGLPEMLQQSIRVFDKPTIAIRKG